MKKVYVILLLLFSVTVYGNEYQKLCQLASSNDSVALEQLLSHKEIVQIMDEKKRTLLFCAAKTGAYKSAKLLLDKGIEPNKKDKNNQTALEYLLEEELVSHYPGYRNKSHDFIKTGMLFLHYGADVNTVDSYGKPLLMKVHRPVLVRMLVAYGADIHAKDKYGRNALLNFAASVGLSDEKRVKILKILLENGADLKSKDSEGKDFYQHLKHSSKYLFFKHMHYPANLDQKTIKKYLQEAMKDHAYETIDLLLKMENLANDTGYYKKPLAFDAIDDSKILEIFFKYGLDANSKSGNRTLLQEAIKKGAVQSVKLIIEHQPKDFNTFQTVATIMNVDDENISMQMAELLFSKGVNITVADKQGHTLLHLAAKKSKDTLCQYFLDKGISVDIKDKEGATPILYALTLGDNDKCAQKLLNSGADIHQTIGNNVTLLHAAVKGRHFDIVKQLLDQGMDPNETDGEGHNALQLAAKNGDLDSFKLLMQKGANIQALDRDNASVLHYACGWDKPIDMAKFLLEQGLDVDAKTKKGETALLIAVKNGNLAVALYLINQKANVNIQDEKGNTALHYAVEKYNKEMIVLLLLKGADKNIQNKEGLNALALSQKKHPNDKEYQSILNGEYHSYLLDDKSIFDFKNLADIVLYAANGGNIAVINDDNQSLLNIAQIKKKTDVENYLITSGFTRLEKPISKKEDVNALDKDGYTPLMNCAVHNYFEKAKKLLNSGAKADIQDQRGRTALYIAVHDHYETAEILLKNGANSSLRTKEDDTPLLYTIRNGNEKMASLLLKYNANPNIMNSHNDTPLHMAVLDDNEPIVKALLEKKANPNQPNDVGLSPLDYAKNLKLKNIIALFSPIEKVSNNVHTQNIVPVETEKIPRSTMVTQSAEPIDNKYMQTKLHQAVASGNIDEVKRLLQNPININTVDKLGRTPLHYAAFKGNVKIANLLLEKGANINAVDKSKQWTPLFFAVFMNHQSMVVFLKKKGADETVKDKLNKIADDYKKDK